MRKLKSVIRDTYLYIVATPLLLVLLGAASNQLVLATNWGKFPVMLNSAEQAKLQQSDEPQRDWSNSFSVWDAGILTRHLKVDVDSDGMIDDVHCVMSKSNHLKFLADWINLQSVIASPGDLLIMLGSFLWNFAPIIWLTLILRKIWVERSF